MTITITKTRLAIAIVAMALIGAGTAMAVDDNPFTDVPDSGNADAPFYSEPVEWLWDNGLTTGTSATTFSPNDTVTRGQYAAFNFRYDEQIVQPLIAALQAELDAAEADVAALEAAPRIVAFATVLSDGTVVSEQSRNVADASVTREAVSAFCFRDLGFEFTNVTASSLYELGDNNPSLSVGLPGAGFGAGDCAGSDAVLEIATYEAGSFAPHGFTVVFYA